jgi:hypothetical protein
VISKGGGAMNSRTHRDRTNFRRALGSWGAVIIRMATGVVR